MSTRPKYHFLTVVSHSVGKSFVALPGQSFGRKPVPAGILVKDKKKSSVLAKARKDATEGEIYFTTTLREAASGCLVAEDICPLRSPSSVFHSDAEECYNAYLESLKQNSK